MMHICSHFEGFSLTKVHGFGVFFSMAPLWRSAVAAGRHQDLPTLDFQHFDAAFARLRSAREALAIKKPGGL